MSRQIQIRRGTAAEHENFTGAIGEITMDTDNNTLRLHDGQTRGGHVIGGATLPDNIDYVVACQLPSADNNYTWYRKYKSGWVEQGGHAIASDTTTARRVELAVTMADVNYTLTLGLRRENTTTGGCICIYEVIGARTVESFGCIGQWINDGSSGRTAYNYNWIVTGFGA